MESTNNNARKVFGNGGDASKKKRTTHNSTLTSESDGSEFVSLTSPSQLSHANFISTLPFLILYQNCDVFRTFLRVEYLI